MNFVTIILVVFLFTLISSVSALLKKILGAAVFGDLVPGLYSLDCISANDDFTTFLLFTRSHPDDPRLLIPNDWRSLQQSEFDPSIPTKIIIHGFLDNMRLSDWMIKMKNALLREGDYNVIITDWTCGNGFPYSQAVTNSKIAAQKLEHLIIFLQQAREVDFSTFHIIGHSLGCQMAGRIGQNIPGLGRITGLDPAGLKFYNVPPEERLDPSDALFVDVIHTDGGDGLFEGLGLKKQIGHVDFYPNGGETQPGCHSSPFSVFSRIGLQRAARYYLTCDHMRSVDFYIESIDAVQKNNPSSYCQYVGIQCRDWESFAEGRCADCSIPGNCAVMGHYSDSYPFRFGVNGATKFFIKTSQTEPYCLHQYQVVLETAGVGSGSRDTTVEFEAGISSGVVYLEMTTETGKVSKFHLNEFDNDRMRPNKRYVYLTTTKFPLGEVQTANMWWGGAQRPTVLSPVLNSEIGFKIHKIEITPIAMDEQLEGRSTKRHKITLCGKDNELLTESQLYQMSVGGC